MRLCPRVTAGSGPRELPNWVAPCGYFSAEGNGVRIAQRQGGEGPAGVQLYYRQVGQDAPAQHLAGELPHLPVQGVHQHGHGTGIVNHDGDWSRPDRWAGL